MFVDSRGPSVHCLRLRRTSDILYTVLPEFRRLCLSGLQIVGRERVVLTNVPLRTFGTNPRTNSLRTPTSRHGLSLCDGSTEYFLEALLVPAATCFRLSSFIPSRIGTLRIDSLRSSPPLATLARISSVSRYQRRARPLPVKPSSRPSLQTLKYLTSLTIFPAPVAIFSHALFHSLPQAHLCCHINPPRAFFPTLTGYQSNSTSAFPPASNHWYPA